MMAIGTVTQYNAERGFGFITPNDGGRDVFAHVSNLVEMKVLEQGQTVEFGTAIDERRNKPQAVNICAVKQWDDMGNNNEDQIPTCR
jgi:CspA family cold shock protein